MRSPEEITEFIATAAININTKVSEAVLADVFQEFENAREGSPRSDTRIWRIIIESKITKIAAAAVIMLAVSLVAIQWLSNDESERIKLSTAIEIPPELAQMPVEQLMDIHLGKTETTFDAYVVTAALEQALDKLGAMEILALAKTSDKWSGSRRPRISASRMAYHPKAITAAVEDADIIIRARVNQKELDASDLKAAIVERNLSWIEDFSANIRAEVELEVLEGYPKLPGDNNGTLLLHPSFNTRRLDRIKQGGEYIIALHDRGGVIWMLSYSEGIYPIDPNIQVASGFRAGPMPIDDAWHLICDCYDSVHEGKGPSQEALEYWTDRLRSDNLTENWTAVEYFNTLPEAPVDAQMIAEAIQQQIKMSIEKTDENQRQFQNEKYQRATFVKEAFNLLITLGDPNVNQQMAELYRKEHTLDDSIFNKDFASVYANSFAEQATKLVPTDFAALQSRKACRASLSGVEKIATAIQRYEADEISINSLVSVLRENLTSQDTEFVPFLTEIVTKHWAIPGFIATRVPDPCFIEPLRQAIEERPYKGDFIRALYACGAEEEAVEFAYAELAQYVNDPNRPELKSKSHYSMRQTILVLGESEDETVRDVVEAATYGDVFRGRYVNDLQGAAIMAFARVARESGIERLHELYSGHDYYMRIVAAVSLYYLGDDTGYELIEHFINHTERSVPAIEMRWHVDMHGGEPFHDALLYFRSPETDRLFLSRLRNGVSDKDIEALEIARDHENEALPILVDNLSSRHRWSRKNANEMLKNLTGQSFGFEPALHPNRQHESIEQWRRYVKDYLAGLNNY